MYNARTTAKDGIPGNTGYLDLQPLGTFANAGLGRATPLHVWAGSSGAKGNAEKKLVGYRSGGSNFEMNPLFDEIMNDSAFQDKFATTKPDGYCNVVDMEAYALAKVCMHFDVNFKCMKFISDIIGQGDQASD